MKENNHKLIFFTVLLASFAVCPAAHGETYAVNDTADFFEMSMEQLMEIQVVSASRQPQKTGELSVPVSIITAEDIHYSGLRSIPEILQFTPGVDVIRLSRYRYAVGVRGLHDWISDRTLTLINGRIADSTLFGGSEFYRLPIFPEDIDRIEVVRGPGGAAWGANAFTGVINIITKKPHDILGGFISTNINEFGDTFTHLRYAEKLRKWSWRTSLGYEDFESSDEAGAGRYQAGNPALNGVIGFPGVYSARDFARNLRFDSEAIYDYSDKTQISFGLGYSHTDIGDWESLGVYPMQNGWTETIRPFTKVDHTFESQIRGDWYSETQKDWSTRLTALYAMDEQKDHTLRFSFANAFDPIKNKQIKGRKILVKKFKSIVELKKLGESGKEELDRRMEAIKECHVLFVCSSEKEYIKDIIATLKNQPILTVGDTKGFLKSGGIINFIMEKQKVRFEINLIDSKNSKLQIRSQLLRLAKRVIK